MEPNETHWNIRESLLRILGKEVISILKWSLQEEKKKPFISLETAAIGKPTSLELSSSRPGAKVEEQNKTFGPLLCLCLSKVGHTNLDVDFYASILLMAPLVPWLHKYVVFECFFSSLLRTYFYDMNFGSSFTKSHSFPQSHIFPTMFTFPPLLDPVTYIVVHTLHEFFPLSLSFFCQVYSTEMFAIIFSL